MGTRLTQMSLLWVLLLSESVLGLLTPVIRHPKPYPTVQMPYISPQQMESAFAQAQTNAKQRSDLEKKLPSTGGTIPKGSKSAQARHQRFTAIDPEAIQIDENQEIFEESSKYLVTKFNLNKEQAAYGLGQVDLPHGSNRARSSIQSCRNMFNSGACSANYKFRSADGSCNNLENPTWGKSLTCFQRLLPPDYADGLSVPRVAQSGNPLPNPRVVSRFIHNDRTVHSTEYTLMTMQWGQFMDHDITLTPMSRAGSSMEMIECCPLNNRRQNHPECFPIEIPLDDDFYGAFNQDCLNFVRSAACNAECTLGPRQQTNQLTAYIDASNVYGSEKNDSDALRLFRGGLMKFQDTRAGVLLPQSRDPNNDQCSRPQQNAFCFQAGDERVNEQPGLTSMHTIWLRQHNRIAKYFQGLYPRANDEAVYQETRRIVGAQLQAITYGEFLPVILGPAYMDYYHLWPLSNGFTQYDPETQPTIVHEFSTAAYRFGHTLIQNVFPEKNSNGASGAGLPLQDNYFFPFTLYNGELDPVVRGLFSSPAQQFDRHIVQAVTNHLYKAPEDSFGMDLPALNLQRARDHGLNGYTSYVDYCFDVKINSFQDLTQLMTSENVQKLSQIYQSVHDIELFTGGVSETPMPNAVVGPTFGCIIGLQFYHLKFGDRFYFEHQGQSGSFTQDQLNTIRSTLLAKVICANSGIQSLPANVFRPTNRLSNCDNLNELNLDFW